jgi:hypothetical protein
VSTVVTMTASCYLGILQRLRVSTAVVLKHKEQVLFVARRDYFI